MQVCANCVRFLERGHGVRAEERWRRIPAAERLHWVPSCHDMRRGRDIDGLPRSVALLGVSAAGVLGTVRGKLAAMRGRAMMGPSKGESH